jgi:hypothetical protein
VLNVECFIHFSNIPQLYTLVSPTFPDKSISKHLGLKGQSSAQHGLQEWCSAEGFNMNEMHKYTYYDMFQSHFLDVSSMYVESVPPIVKNRVNFFFSFLSLNLTE